MSSLEQGIRSVAVFMSIDIRKKCLSLRGNPDPDLDLFCSVFVSGEDDNQLFGRNVAGNHPDQNWKCATLLRAVVQQILIYHTMLPLLEKQVLRWLIFNRNIFVSSPNTSVENIAPSFSLSSIKDHVFDTSSEDARDSANERSCTFSHQNFAICVNVITARHGTSDAEA